MSADFVCEATGGSSVAPFAAMFLGGLRGHQAEITPLIEATLAAAEAGGQGGAMTGAHWAAAVPICALSRTRVWPGMDARDGGQGCHGRDAPAPARP